MFVSEDSPSAVCDECGARRVGGFSCSEQLGLLIAWEYDDPELRAEHFLTVATYNLQHPSSFTDAAITGLRQALIDHLEHGVPVSELRRRASAVLEGKERVLRPDDQRTPVRRAWTLTISDVYTPEQRDGAAARVRRWAAAVRREM